MSLIEHALDKLRRSGEPTSTRPDLIATRAVNATPAVAPAPTTVDHAAKRMDIDLTAVRAAGYLPEQGQERRFADHFRQIKRPLIETALLTHSTPDARLVIVSSALPGDGKTFTTINLALSLARERDVSVLLIDADVPKGHISHVFGLDNEPGLLDALGDESIDVQSLIIRTDIRGLDVLPAGRPVEGATELLASERMAQVVTRLGARNGRRLCLFDAPPLLVSSEARALVRIAARVVLVVRAGHTPRQAVLDAMAHVEPKKLQGLILNQAPVRRGDGYYSYSGYGSSDEKAG